MTAAELYAFDLGLRIGLFVGALLAGALAYVIAKARGKGGNP